MKLIISDDIRNKYPDLRIGVVVAEAVNNADHSSELIAYTKEQFEKFVDKYVYPEDLRKHKNIQAWREIYCSFGVKPKKYKPTAESFLVRVLKGHIPKISPAVDSYLISETLHCLPVGGYDLDTIDGDITLRHSQGEEEFLAIGAEELEATGEGEVIYADEKRILTRRWNFRDCDACKIDVPSNKIALFVEGAFLEIEDAEIQETTADIASNLEKFCNAKTKILFLDKEMNELEITS